MRTHFLGGVDTVTGSQHLVEANGHRVLRDAGMFQGRRTEANEINRRLPFDAAGIHSLVLSHAHIDHCGNVPTVVKNGFHGTIWATTATVDLCRVMLADAARIQEQDAAYLNQKTNRAGLEPIVPLYTSADAEAAMRLFRGVRYGDTIEAAPGQQVLFSDAGHILGAALTTFTLRENGRKVRVCFAIDLGRKNLPLIRDPEPLRDVDVLVIESTYGDRLHDDAPRAKDQIREVIHETLARGGRVLIPSFALERAQEIIYHLASLVAEGRLPRVPVYLDSPMAADLTRIFEKHYEYLDEESRALRSRIGSVVQPDFVHFISTVEESKSVTAADEPAVVIASSGMCEHGRILHHLKHGIGNPRNTILIVGFQAEQTLGRRLAEGARRVRIFGDEFERRAQVVVLNSLSGHADRNELLAYVKELQPKSIYLVHGESAQRAGFAAALNAAGFARVFLPARGDVVEL